MLVAESVVIDPVLRCFGDILVVGHGLDCTAEMGELVGFDALWGQQLTGAGDDDGDDEAVDTEDTSHDDGDNRLNDQLGLEHGDGADADAGLGSAVGGTEVAEHEGRHDAHAAEEQSLVGVTVHCTQIVAS